MSRRDVIHRSIAAALICAAAASAWWRLLGPGATLFRIIPAVLIVAIAFAAGTAGGRRVARGTGALMGLAGTFAAGFILGAITLEDSTGSVSPGAIVSGTLQGLGILLRSPVPAPLNSETVTAAIIFTGYATMMSALLMCTKRPALALIPSMMLFVGATALSEGSIESPTSSGIVFLLACTGAMALVPSGDTGGSISDGAEFAEPQRAPGSGRIVHGVFVLSLCVLITGTAVVLAQLTGLGSKDKPYDPHQTDNYRPETKVNPVNQVNQWQTIERRSKFPLMTVSGAALPKAFVWATAEFYNGASWQTIKTFSDVEPTIPYVPPPRLRWTRPVQASVTTTEDLPGPWLPAPYRPTAVTGVPIRSDGDAVVISRSDKAKSTDYAVTANVLALKNLRPLQSASGTDRDSAGRATELPTGVPLSLIDFADNAMAGGGSAYQRLTRLADATAGPEFRESSTAGADVFSYRALDNMITTSKSGSEAQFATAFAVMARTQGFSSRLVAGYAMPSAAGGKVTTRSAIVWPEVNFTNVGWVPFAPGPQDLARGVPVPSRYKAPPKPPPAPKPKPKPTVKPKPEPTKPPEPKPADQTIPTWAFWLLGIMLAIAAWLGAIVLWRRRLIKKLRTGAADGPAAGAWIWIRSVRRHLRVELPQSPRSTAQDTTASAQLRAVAQVADEALYGPTVDDPAGSDQVWANADLVVAQDRGTAGLRGRLRWLLVPIRRVRDRIKTNAD
ncbi:MAG: transglutaminase-like domain-containing protein [Candidatus Nanopelagicales bacterium]